MGFKQHKNTPPMERELNYLLYDLCVNWGFCIPPVSAENISKQDYLSSKDFAFRVVEAEGMDATLDGQWVNKISERFKERFGQEEIAVETFVDRVRGVPESW